jgi:hypothetical protein
MFLLTLNSDFSDDFDAFVNTEYFFLKEESKVRFLQDHL